MAPPKDSAPWQMKPEEVEKALAGEQFDDCTACRVTGMRVPKVSSYQSDILTRMNVFSRLCGIHRTRSVQLRYRHAEPTTARKGHHAEPNQVQDGLETAGHRHHLCFVDRNGSLEGFQLSGHSIRYGLDDLL